jgi:hypothetical protein
MTQQARHDLLLMSDSDIRATPAMARTIAWRVCRAPGLAVTTCPYRAVAGIDWSRLEALGMNTEFWWRPRRPDARRHALCRRAHHRRPPRRHHRRRRLELLQQYLAEDFMLGNLAAGRGLGVGLSSYVIEHRIGSESFPKNAAHRIRWNRSTRRSRPLGYLGQVFTNPLPLRPRPRRRAARLVARALPGGFVPRQFRWLGHGRGSVPWPTRSAAANGRRFPSRTCSASPSGSPASSAKPSNGAGNVTGYLRTAEFQRAE